MGDDQQGFTLLELLVVLVVVGLTASFVGPNLWHAYVKAEERSRVQMFADALMQLRQQAYHRGRTIRLPALSDALNGNAQAAGQSEMPAMPDGWVLERSSALRFLPSGVTNGGTFFMRSPVGRRWQLNLAPLDGRATIRSVESAT